MGLLEDFMYKSWFWWQDKGQRIFNRLVAAYVWLEVALIVLLVILSLLIVVLKWYARSKGIDVDSIPEFQGDSVIARLLSYFGLILIDSDAIARRLAGQLLHLWGSDLYQLAESTGKQELQRRYMELAMATGLPGSISRQVADRAWHYVKQSQATPVVENKGFSFYW